MAIIPLTKITLFGTADQKDTVLDGLQELGCLHLVDLSRGQGSQARASNVSPDALQAVKFLRTCPTPRRATRDPAGFQFDEVVDRALHIARQYRLLQVERDELKPAIRQLAAWGDFRLPAADELAGLKLWFYAVPHYRLAELEQLTQAWQIISRDHRFAYVVVLSGVEPRDVPVPRVRLSDRPLSELQHRLDEVEAELEELHLQRIRLTRWTHQLSRTIGLAEDRAARLAAAENALDAPQMFAVQGWAPRSQVGSLRALAREHGLGITLEQPAADESPPTLLSNTGLAAGGQGAVSFYTTPAYRAWDPSGVVFFSFSIFFAMIMADAGYAALLGILLVLFWRRLGRSPEGLGQRKLFAAIVIASTAYGVVIGSYFGLPPASGSLLCPLHVIDAGNTSLMMRISIVIGVAHLAFANLALAWSRRWSARMLSSVGWALALVGGLTFGLARSGTEPTDDLIRYGTWAMAGGFVGIILFSSDRPLLTLSLKDHIGRVLEGGLSLASIPRAFGDVLSYLRLFALGLASAQLGATFNDLTYKASAGVGIGGLLAIGVVVFGHGLNFALAIMSGVVHGLRLNCIEFFGWSLPEEGYPFQPFCKKAV